MLGFLAPGVVGTNVTAYGLPILARLGDGTIGTVTASLGGFSVTQQFKSSLRAVVSATYAIAGDRSMFWSDSKPIAVGFVLRDQYGFPPVAATVTLFVNAVGCAVLAKSIAERSSTSTGLVDLTVSLPAAVFTTTGCTGISLTYTVVGISGGPFAMEGSYPITQSLTETQLFPPVTGANVIVMLPLALIFPSTTYALPVFGKIGYYVGSMTIVVAKPQAPVYFTVNSVSAFSGVEFTAGTPSSTVTQYAITFIRSLTTTQNSSNANFPMEHICTISITTGSAATIFGAQASGNFTIGVTLTYLSDAKNNAIPLRGGTVAPSFSVPATTWCYGRSGIGECNISAIFGFIRTTSNVLVYTSNPWFTNIPYFTRQAVTLSFTGKQYYTDSSTDATVPTLTCAATGASPILACSGGTNVRLTGTLPINSYAQTINWTYTNAAISLFQTGILSFTVWQPLSYVFTSSAPDMRVIQLSSGARWWQDNGSGTCVPRYETGYLILTVNWSMDGITSYAADVLSELRNFIQSTNPTAVLWTPATNTLAVPAAFNTSFAGIV